MKLRIVFLAYPNTYPMKILLADAHPMVREGIKSILKEHMTIQEIVEITDYTLIPAYVLQKKIDLIITEFNFPSDHFMAVIRKIKKMGTDIPIIVFSNEAIDNAEAFKNAGVSITLNKNCSDYLFIDSVQKVLKHTGIKNKYVVQLRD